MPGTSSQLPNEIPPERMPLDGDGWSGVLAGLDPANPQTVADAVDGLVFSSEWEDNAGAINTATTGKQVIIGADSGPIGGGRKLVVLGGFIKAQGAGNGIHVGDDTAGVFGFSSTQGLRVSGTGSANDRSGDLTLHYLKAGQYGVFILRGRTDTQIDNEPGTCAISGAAAGALSTIYVDGGDLTIDAGAGNASGIDGCLLLGGISTRAVVTFYGDAEPADLDIDPGMGASWFDAVSGRIKVKYNDGGIIKIGFASEVLS